MSTEKDRLVQIMEQEQLTAQQFAKEVGIQPGTVSNIMSERNRPSLEVMQKVLNRFRMLSPDWLILGVGSMYRQKNESQQPVLFDYPPEHGLTGAPVSASQTAVSVPPSAHNAPLSAQQGLPLVPAPNGVAVANLVETPAPLSRRITKICVFYDDGTFEELHSNEIAK